MKSDYSVHTPLQALEDFVKKYETEFSGGDPEADFAEIEQVWPVSIPRLNREKQSHGLCHVNARFQIFR